MSQHSDLTAVDLQAIHTYPSPEPPSKRMCMESRGSSDRMTIMDIRTSILSATSGLASTPISPPVSPDVSYKEIGHSSPATSNLKDPVLFLGDIPLVETSVRLFPPQIDQCAIRERDDSLVQRSSGQLLSRSDVHVISGSKGRTVHSTSLCSRVGSLYNQSPMRLLTHLKSEWSSTSRPAQSTTMNSQAIAATGIQHDQSIRKSARANTRSNMVTITESIVSIPPKKTTPFQTASKTADQKPLKRRTEDVDFESLPDYCPPITALTNPEALRVDWPGSPIDLCDDPNRHLLDRKELGLASKLRLSCATYLCSKRRIFIGRVASLETGKDFRKTDAQQACKIDVNKASKLWTAYENSGWFQPTLFDGRMRDRRSC